MEAKLTLSEERAMDAIRRALRAQAAEDPEPETRAAKEAFSRKPVRLAPPTR